MQNRTKIVSLTASILILGLGILLGSSSVFRIPKIEASVEQEPNTDEIAELVTKSTTAFSAGRYQDALNTATKICELRPENIRYQMLRGEVAFAAGKMDACVAAYDAVIRIQPAIEPQLWQRGLALYYADRFADGVKQFETHQTVNSQDVENAVWHLLCAARISDVDQARKKLIPITGDSRIPMSQIYEMFAGRMTPEDVLQAAQATSPRVPAGSGQQKLQLYYAHLYTGLYHEMLGDAEAAQASLNKAEQNNTMGKTNFMGQVARVHLQLRDSNSKQAK